MLHEFLSDKRDTIVAVARRKIAAIAASRPARRELEIGLPKILDRLIGVSTSQAKRGNRTGPKESAAAAAHRAKESLRLGRGIWQIVCGYGLICEAIAETAREGGQEAIPPGEFDALAASLDAALAEAIGGLLSLPERQETPESPLKIGALVHELRNALACAIVAHSMVKEEISGARSRENALLERNLQRMRELIDRSVSEIRAQKGAGGARCLMPALEAVEEVQTAAGQQARFRNVALSVEVDRHLRVDVDRNELVAALLNLVQNAIKFTRRGGRVWIRGIDAGKTVVLEVEDRCGGLPKGKADELFKPFTQKNADRTGLGLGLSICRRAMALNDGELSVRDLPGTGCVFSITLPSAGLPPGKSS